MTEEFKEINPVLLELLAGLGIYGAAPVQPAWSHQGDLCTFWQGFLRACFLQSV